MKSKTDQARSESAHVQPLPQPEISEHLLIKCLQMLGSLETQVKSSAAVLAVLVEQMRDLTAPDDRGPDSIFDRFQNLGWQNADDLVLKFNRCHDAIMAIIHSGKQV